MQFLREQAYRGLNQLISTTRANLCELVASQILRRFDENHRGRGGLLLLVNVLVAGFEPSQNAPEEVLREKTIPPHWPVQKRGGYERKLLALEVAIVSESKTFLTSAVCQKVVDAVYRGQIIYIPLLFVDILPDHYKHSQVSLYNSRRAPLLNQYRSIVPRIRSIIKVCQFAVLLVLQAPTITYRIGSRMTIFEMIFCIYTAG